MTEPSARKPRRRTIADAQRALTRERLMSAAWRVFRDRGYATATVDEIAETADASRTTFYLHFRSKAVLFEAMLRDAAPDSRAHFARLDRLGVPTRAQVEEWVRYTVRYWEKSGWLVAIMRQAVAVDPALATLMIALVEDAVDGMSNYLARGSAREARLRATALVLQLEQFCFLWIVRGAPYDAEAAIHVLTDFWFREFGKPD